MVTPSLKARVQRVLLSFLTERCDVWRAAPDPADAWGRVAQAVPCRVLRLRQSGLVAGVVNVDGALVDGARIRVAFGPGVDVRAGDALAYDGAWWDVTGRVPGYADAIDVQVLAARAVCAPPGAGAP